MNVTGTGFWNNRLLLARVLEKRALGDDLDEALTVYDGIVSDAPLEIAEKAQELRIALENRLTDRPS